MEFSENQITSIVEEVVKRLVGEKLAKSSGSGFKNGVFATIEEAVSAATLAFHEFEHVSLAKRGEIITAMREAIIRNAEELARMAVQETGLGRVADKVAKNLLVARKTPGIEDIAPVAYTGDHGLTLVERAPFGVIGSITPSTNPAATVANNSISMIAAGNSVVFNFHPAARKVSARTVEILNEAIVSTGGPANLITCVAEPTIETAGELMRHPKIRLLVVTGGPGVVKAAFASGKKVICGGPGNPPVVVDETADIEKAARDIVAGASFENNIVCICEKECFVVSSVCDRLKAEMKKCGAYELVGEEINSLMKLTLTPDGHPNRKTIGKDARLILQMLGINVSDDIRLIICEVDKNHLFVQEEMLTPILPIVRTPDVDTAIKWAVEAEHGYGHSAVMHSRNIENLHRMARVINTSIFTKNAPSYAGLGMNGEGYTTMTIASPTGEGITTARTFTRERRCVLKDYFRIV